MSGATRSVTSQVALSNDPDARCIPGKGDRIGLRRPADVAHPVHARAGNSLHSPLEALPLFDAELA
jgi:hypothetical protein